jgi:hypothetical protein
VLVPLHTPFHLRSSSSPPEDRHRRVADELLDRAAVLLQDRAQLGVVAAHHLAKSRMVLRSRECIGRFSAQLVELDYDYDDGDEHECGNVDDSLALVALFGRWNWWMPARLDRVLRVDRRRRHVTSVDPPPGGESSRRLALDSPLGGESMLS